MPSPSTPCGSLCPRLSGLLLTLLVMSTLLPAPASPYLIEAIKHHKLRQANECRTEMEVSAVCYQCAALDPPRFRIIHSQCCTQEGPVRQLCRDWYTEEPKRGRRDVWYY